MNTVDSLRLLAMQAVTGGDSDYSLRFILRWYSRTFHTPLQAVEELPLEDVLQTYFECRYEDMNEIERQQEIDRLLISEEEMASRRRQEDAEEADAAAFAKITEEQLQKRKAAALPQAQQKLDQVASDLKKLAAAIPEAEKMDPRDPEPKPPKILPDIQMKFIDSDDEFEEMLEGGFGPQKRTPG